MSFLAPLFLVGLLGIAVPILIHLTHKRRSQVQAFPSLMFLEQIPFKSSRRQTIENWPLLLLRMLALAIIVAAFARPLFQGGALAAGLTGGPEEVVVLVDRSYSMGYGDRWDRAKDAARDALNALGPEDLGTLIFFGAGADVAQRSTADLTRMMNALDTIEVSSQTTRYGPGLKVAQTILEDTRLANRRVVFISDFQRNGWLGDEGVAFPEGTTVESIPILDDAVSNSAVASPTFQREIFSGRERVIPSVRVTHTGSEGREAVDVTLEVGGRALQTRTIDLAAGDAQTVSFDPFTLTDQYTRGRIQVESDALPQDDAVHFVLSPNQGISTLLLEGPGSQASPFLREALNIGTDPAFLLTAKSTGQFQGRADLDGRSLLILNNTALPGGGAGTQIEEWVMDGGGLLIVLGPRSGWNENDPDILPGTIGAPTDLSGSRGGSLGYIDYSHPIFEIFRGERSGDFSSSTVFRYRPLQVEGSQGVLARYDNGEVAMAERRVGDGRVVVLSTSLDNFWNDLVLQPIFLPLSHQVGQYLADHGESSEAYSAGQVLDLWGRQGPWGSDGPDEGSSELVAISPTGRSIPLPVDETARFLPLMEQGLYEIRPQGGTSGDGNYAIAVNVDLAESDLTTADTEELTAAFSAGMGATQRAEGADAVVRIEDLERRQSLWRYLIVGAFLLLALETFLSNRLSRAAA